LPPPGKQASAWQPATVVIAAPADVRLTVNGQTLALKAREQAFLTPELEPEATYSYVITGEAIRDGQSVVRSRKVMLTAGAEVRVDFRDLAPAARSVANRD
jgi:uncharacterized protein (TIGR03000 family)